MANDINGPLRNVLPGNIDQWNRIYATVADANAAIPSTVVGSRNFREGKVVQIGTVTNFVEHHWFGGFGDGNLVPKGVDPKKVASVTVGTNLFNLATYEPDKFLTSTNVSGINTSNVYFLSDFIPVSPGVRFYSSTDGVPVNMRYVTFFDSNKNYVAGGNPNLSNSVFIPIGVSFVKVTGLTSSLPKFQFEKDSVTYYKAYGKELDLEITLPKEAVEKAVNGVYRKSNVEINPTDVSFLELSKNLFNKEAATDGYFAGANGALTASGSYFITDYIPVEVGKTYYGSKNGAVQAMRFRTAYNANKAVISSAGSDSSSNSFTVPDGVSYYRVSVAIAAKEGFQFEKDEITPYIRFGYTLSPDIIVNDSVEVSPLDWTSLGDSITEGNTWQPTVASVLTLTHTNRGIGGTRLSGGNNSGNAFWSDVRVNAIPIGTKVITVLGGTNDWAQSAVIGSADSVNTNEFNGAFNVLVQKLITRFPTAYIAFMTTTYGEIDTWPDRQGWTDKRTNAIGLTTVDYARAVREGCIRLGLHCIETSKIGINTWNRGTYFPDGLHPNTLAASLITREVISSLEKRIR